MPVKVILENIDKGRAPETQEGRKDLGYIETIVHNLKIDCIQDLFRKGAPNADQLIKKIGKEKNKKEKGNSNGNTTVQRIHQTQKITTDTSSHKDSQPTKKIPKRNKRDNPTTKHIK